MRIFRFIIMLMILAFCCGCLAHGSAHIVHDLNANTLTTDVDYFRLGDQELSDFDMTLNKDGTGKVSLGAQNSEGSALNEIFLKGIEAVLSQSARTAAP